MSLREKKLTSKVKKSTLSLKQIDSKCFPHLKFLKKEMVQIYKNLSTNFETMEFPVQLNLNKQEGQPAVKRNFRSLPKTELMVIPFNGDRAKSLVE